MGLKDDKQFVPHALRHTCASRLAQGGMTIQKIQRWLGHKSLTQTMRYAHLTPADLVEGAGLLERSLDVPKAG
jgi:integrase